MLILIVILSLKLRFCCCWDCCCVRVDFCDVIFLLFDLLGVLKVIFGFELFFFLWCKELVKLFVCLVVLILMFKMLGSDGEWVLKMVFLDLFLYVIIGFLLYFCGEGGILIILFFIFFRLLLVWDFNFECVCDFWIFFDLVFLLSSLDLWIKCVCVNYF